MAGQPVVNPLSQPGPLGGQPQTPGNLQFFNPGASTTNMPTASDAFGPARQRQPVTAPFPSTPVQPPSFMAGGGGNVEGSIGSGGTAPTRQGSGSFFPNVGANEDDFENEEPLLEELGINIDHIWQRIQGIVFFKRLDQEMLADADLSGPLLIGLALGFFLMLAGKLQFGFVYGICSTGCIFIWMLVNVMSAKGGLDLYSTASLLGYGLIPIVMLAFVGIFISLKNTFGTVVSIVCIFWATATSSRFFDTALSMRQQRWLVAYPVGLVYTCFTLITVF